MVFIEELVRPYIAQSRSCESLSIACVTTTNPVYLIFTEEHSHPELVVRIADSEEKVRAHHVIERLYDVLGELVPKPIAMTQFRGQCFAIQKGLVGLPWFRLASKYTTSQEWNELRRRAYNALFRLHEGIRCNSEWKKTSNPGDELRECFQSCVEMGICLSPIIGRLVEQWGAQLDSLGTITTYSQHGDFCLNNLIVGMDNVAVIDFDDFGMTSMPLHDEFTLALSMYSLSPGARASTPKDELKECVKDSVASLGLSCSMLPAFFLCHLLFRLGEWSQPQRRQRYRAWLLSLTEAFAQKPSTFFEEERTSAA